MKILRTMMLALGLLVMGVVNAQFANPVKVETTLKNLSETEAEIIFNATIETGWHMYSTNVIPDGPTATTFNAEVLTGAELVGPLQAVGNVQKHYEEMFGTDVFFFEGSYSEYESNKMKRLGLEEPKRIRYRKLMED